MLKECIEVFNCIPEEDREARIIDNHIPADGLYILVSSVGDSFEVKDYFEVKLDKKTRRVSNETNINFPYIRYCDYKSKLLNMNKPVDTKKVIQSNNYLSFFIKKENLTSGKLTEDVINNYYSILEKPEIKYDKPKAKEVYQSVEKDLGPVNVELVEKIRKWILENIFNLGIKVEGKDYLKIFFDYPKVEYDRESKRYLIPNIYNSNDFNQKVDGVIYGLPNNNMGLNSKKPYLENKSRKVKLPTLLSGKEVLDQKMFFDYLMNNAAAGLNTVYINYNSNQFIPKKSGEVLEEEFSGIILRILKGKNEAEIIGYDIIPKYSFTLKKKFDFNNIIDIDLVNLPSKSEVPSYGVKQNKKELQGILDNVLFSKFLTNNYFTEAKDISVKDSVIKCNLLLSRDSIFNWIYKDVATGISEVLDKVSMNLLKQSIANGYFIKASHQFNMRWSLKEYFKEGEKRMADILSEIKNNLKIKVNSDLEEGVNNDREYYFAVGQMVSFLLSKNKGKNKPMSLINPFINAKDSTFLKQRLTQLYKKYNYDIDFNNKRFKKLYTIILGYEPEGKVDQDFIIAGYLSSNIIYEKNKEE